MKEQPLQQYEEEDFTFDMQDTIEKLMKEHQIDQHFLLEAIERMASLSHSVQKFRVNQTSMLDEERLFFKIMKDEAKNEEYRRDLCANGFTPKLLAHEIPAHDRASEALKMAENDIIPNIRQIDPQTQLGTYSHPSQTTHFR